jgi:glyoxylate reductase
MTGPRWVSTVPRTMLSGRALEILQGLPDVFVPERSTLSRDALLRYAPEMTGLLVDAIDPVDREIIEAAPDLQVISSMGAGYDNVDMQAANERGVLVCNAPGFSTGNVADHVFGMMLLVGRRMLEHNRLLRDGRYQDVHNQVLYGHRVSGATLGIVGLGAIGTAVARRARAFDMPVLYTSRTPKPDLERELDLVRAELPELLERSDYVSLHTELTAETTRLIGRAELALMKPTAVLINTGRGGLVDTDALVDALSARRILGAGLDVTDPEPLPGDHPLLALDNVFITPHTAFATHEALTGIAEACVQALIDVHEGRRPRFLVNPGVFEGKT